MKRIMLELSDELGAAIDAALAGRHRNPTLESWLWRVREIHDAAKLLGVRKPVRVAVVGRRSVRREVRHNARRVTGPYSAPVHP